MSTSDIIEPIKGVVEAQGHLFKLSLKGFPRRRRLARRGRVCEFSRHSRKRMLDLQARLDIERAGFVAFVTLTYPDREGPPSAGNCERDRRAFLKRMRRRNSSRGA